MADMKLPLYHGSVAEIAEFIPRDGVDASGVKYEKPSILATPLKKYAMLYAMKLKEGFSRESVASALGGVKDKLGVDAKDYMHTNQVINGTPCAVIRNRGKFLAELEKAGGGGYIYTMPSETFSPVVTPDGAATEEWRSQHASIAPTHREQVTLEQAMQEGCQVLFVKDGVDFQKLAKENETKFDCKQAHIDFYQSLVDQGILVSENAKRGIPNPLHFGEKQEAITPHWSAMPRNQVGRISNRHIE